MGIGIIGKVLLTVISFFTISFIVSILINKSLKLKDPRTKVIKEPRKFKNTVKDEE